MLDLHMAIENISPSKPSCVIVAAWHCAFVRAVVGVFATSVSIAIFWVREVQATDPRALMTLGLCDTVFPAISMSASA